jgi:hypothetical protein
MSKASELQTKKAFELQTEAFEVEIENSIKAQIKEQIEKGIEQAENLEDGLAQLTDYTISFVQLWLYREVAYKQIYIGLLHDYAINEDKLKNMVDDVTH